MHFKTIESENCLNKVPLDWDIIKTMPMKKSTTKIVAFKSAISLICAALYRIENNGRALCVIQAGTRKDRHNTKRVAIVCYSEN